jgi:hypothetical protein
MNRNGLLTILVCLTMICTFSSPSLAVMKGLSTDELAKASETVVIGEVEEVEAQWSSDGKTIFTSSTISISEVVTGRTLPGKIVVEYEGGEIGDIGLKISDMATLDKGDKVLLFLKTARSKKFGSAYNMIGKAQGKYKIGEDGIARKGGFSIADGGNEIDNDLPVDVLAEKIRRTK